MVMVLDDLVEAGLTVPFYGAIAEMFRLGDIVYQAVEDESDGYRSMLEKVAIVTDLREAGALSMRKAPISYVKVVAIEEVDGFQGYELRDALIDFCWGRIGTNRHDDYYPSFCADFPALDPDKPCKLLDGGEITTAEFERQIQEIASLKKPSRRKRAKPKAPAEPVDEYANNPQFGSW